jgi:hypothetical protein
LRFAFVLITSCATAFLFGVACERKRFNDAFPNGFASEHFHDGDRSLMRHFASVHGFNRRAQIFNSLAHTSAIVTKSCTIQAEVATPASIAGGPIFTKRQRMMVRCLWLF